MSPRSALSGQWAGPPEQATREEYHEGPQHEGPAAMWSDRWLPQLPHCS